MRTLIWAFVLAAVCAVAPAQAQTSIQDILDNPGKYSESTVEVTGTVTRHISSGNTGTKNYILQADTGQELRVRTSQEPPTIGNDFTVSGIISISAINREPVLSENERSAAGPGGGAENDTRSSSDALRDGFSTTTIFLIFGLGILVVVVLGYFAYAAGEEQQPAATSTNGTPESASSSASSEASLKDTELDGADDDGPSDAEQRIKSESSSSSSSSGEKSEGPATLKFKAPPKTMKFIPGKLVVAAGPDQGKEFRIAGHPTPEGNVVTIGRAEIEGERAFAHIQLGDTYRTVSRIQSEIIQQDQTILLKNKSTTNPTMVNGEGVEAESTVELEDGDMIRMGELMLRYERE